MCLGDHCQTSHLGDLMSQRALSKGLTRLCAQWLWLPVAVGDKSDREHVILSCCPPRTSHLRRGFKTYRTNLKPPSLRASKPLMAGQPYYPNRSRTNQPRPALLEFDNSFKTYLASLEPHGVVFSGTTGTWLANYRNSSLPDGWGWIKLYPDPDFRDGDKATVEFDGQTFYTALDTRSVTMLLSELELCDPRRPAPSQNRDRSRSRGRNGSGAAMQRNAYY